ncbi:MAG TPA: hypothetical protein VD761_08110 [Solirubrobacterales bacterium]|nr:hypothetical protein [Solirubrobacterales bacterium]
MPYRGEQRGATTAEEAATLRGRRIVTRGNSMRGIELSVRAAVLWCAALALCLAALAYAPSGAQAAEERHLFDPELSLTGSCSPDGSDPVPDPWCPGPPAPSAAFENPSAAVDFYGNMYISSHEDGGPDGRVDVFSPEGEFLTEVEIEGARSLAVDAEGHLYVAQFIVGGTRQVTRFSPTLYNPTEGEIEYGDPGEVIIEEDDPGECNLFLVSAFTSIAVDFSTGRLFVSSGQCVSEFSSASEAEPNQPLNLSIGDDVLTSWSASIAVDAAHNRIYVASAKEDAPTKGVVEVFELEAPNAHLGTLTGADTPAGSFQSGSGEFSVDVNEGNGHLFVSDIRNSKKIYEMGTGLGAGEEHLNTFERDFTYVVRSEIAVDNSPTSPNQGSFYAPAGSSTGTLDHTFAFILSELGPPTVESVSTTGVTTSEAVLRARINPEGASTTYRFEYTTQQSFESSGFAGASVAGGGTLPEGKEGVDISAAVSGLAPGTTYRFRVVAKNSIGEDADEGGFRTFLELATGGPCPNEEARTGIGISLPDCRGYELVTPPDTNGRTPLGGGPFGIYFPMLLASPDGNRASFRIEGGALPGAGGAGGFNGENYLSRRGSTGWTTELIGPSGTEALAPQPGGVSPDQEYSFWNDELPGELTLFPQIRYPDGHSEPVGRGSLGVDPRVNAQLISQDGSHIVFATINVPKPPKQLEPNAPPSGTTAVYDRTSDGVTHVVSLLPGDVTPAPGQNATYVGASYDGEGIAFKIGAKTYLRQDNRETYEVGSNVTFAGIAEGGGRIFYLQGGNLFALDTATENRIAFSKGGDATAVNVSADGSTAYFVSPDILTSQSNPQGAVAQGGKENMYVSRSGVIAFVGIVTPLDVASEPLFSGEVLGLGQWTRGLVEGKPAVATSRTTPGGSVLLFESQANLTGYDSDEHVQVYRYDARVPSLSCLSCSPTDAPATSDASLQTIQREASGSGAVISNNVRIPNVRPDGERLFFQTFEALAPTDVDGQQDVYEWEAFGVGSCDRPDGCTYLITSGQSARDEHLYGHSISGDDVFFLSSETLLEADFEQTPSVYDARVGGGFAQPASGPCQGEGCRGILTPPPPLPAPASPVVGDGNVSRGCAKGKRKVVRKGKVRCVKKKKRSQRQRKNKQRAAATRRAGK